MTQLISGIAYLTKSLLITTTIYIAVLVCGKPVLKRKGNCLCFKHYLLYTYIILVGLITGVFNFNTWQFKLDCISYNIIPFTNESLFFLALNILLFFPLGILVPLVWKKVDSWKGIFIIGVLASLAIELVQMFFTGRLADIDDLIANSMGSLLGYGLLSFFRVLIGKNRVKPIGRGTSSLFISVSSFCWGIGYKGITVGDIVLYNLGIDTFQTELRFSGFITVTLAILAFMIGIKYKSDFLANLSVCISIISVCMAVSLF